MTIEGITSTLALLAQTEVHRKSLLEHISSGGPIGMVIIVLSFIAVVLIVAHMVQLRLTRLAPEGIVDDLDRLLGGNDVAGALTYCQDKENDTFLTRVVGAALARCSKSPFGFLEFRSALEEAGQDEVARLQRSTEGLGLIAAVAPMLGLLGTVVGMVGAFETISTSEGFARPDQLAGSISVALITTVLGLIVAIPCTAAFTFFRSRIDHLSAEIARTTESLLAHVESASGAAAPGAKGGAARVRPAAPGGAGAPGGAVRGVRSAPQGPGVPPPPATRRAPAR